MNNKLFNYLEKLENHRKFENSIEKEENLQLYFDYVQSEKDCNENLKNLFTYYQDFDKQLILDTFYDNLKTALSILTDEERFVVVTVYGLYEDAVQIDVLANGNKHKLKKLISLKRRALKKLRHPSIIKLLEDYFD